MIDTANFVDFASDPAFAVDSGMRVVGWNSAAENLLGYSVDEAVGMKCSEILQAYYPTGEPLCTALCEGRSCIALGKKWNMNACRIRHNSGKMIQAGISTMVLPMDARNGDETIAIVFLREIGNGATTVAPTLPMRVFTFGNFGLTLDGRGLEVDKWKRKQAVQVLKCLVSQVDLPVHRERLIEWIWPNVDPEIGWKRLKVAISFLRNTLRAAGARDDIIETIHHSYRLRREAVVIDASEFVSLVRTGWQELEDGNRARALKLFEDAQDLRDGDYFENDPYAEWCAPERERLREIYLELLTGLARAYAEEENFLEAARVCRTALTSDPCRESFVRALMKNFAAANRPDWAKAQFLAWRRELDESYGLEPTDETINAYVHLLDATATRR